MIGCALGLALGSAVAAIVLAGAGAFAGHLYDELHAAPEEPLDPLPFSEDDRPGARQRTAGEPESSPSGEQACAAGRVPTVEDDPDDDEEDTLPPKRPPGRSPSVHDSQSGPVRDLAGEVSRALCPLFVELARADGEVLREEVRAIREHFEQVLGFNGRSLNTVRNHLKAAIASPAELGQVCARARPFVPASELSAFVDGLYRVALADGSMQRSEHDALRRICRAFEVPADVQARIAREHLGDGDQAYAALGLTPAASNEEIRSAFRRLAAQHHPDRVAHEGAAAVEASTRRFQDLKDAYEELRRLRGL